MELKCIQLESNQEFRHPELAEFKTDKVKAHTFSLDRARKKVRVYRALFLFIGILYSLIAYTLYTKSVTSVCSLLLSNCVQMKQAILCIAIALSGASFFMASKIRIAKEIGRELYCHVRRELKLIYTEKQKNPETTRSLERQYEKTVRLIEQRRDFLTELLANIFSSPQLSKSEKELLVHQAEIEEKESLEKLLHSFESA